MAQLAQNLLSSFPHSNPTEGKEGSRMEKFEQWFQMLSKKLDEVGKEVLLVRGEMGDIRDFIEQHQSDIWLCKLAIERLDGKIEHLDGKIEHLDDKVECLDDKVEHLDGKIEHLDGKIEHLDGKVEHLDGKVGTLQEKIETLEEKIESLPRDNVH